jgi:hypothetical protein
VTPAVASIREGRNALAALNETALLREALIYRIRSLGVLYCIGKRRPISELPEEHQQRVREAYRDTLWSSDKGVELQGIYTSKELAIKACKARGKNWFWVELPIDSCLPEETVMGDNVHAFPASPVREMHENLQAATLAVPVTRMRQIEEELAHLREEAAHQQVIQDEIARLEAIVKAARSGLAPNP